MKKSAAFIALTLSLAASSLAMAQAAPPLPPPPVISERMRSQYSVLEWIPGPVECDGTIIRGASVEKPAPMTRNWAPSDADPSDKLAAYTFRIDNEGRPLSIQWAEGKQKFAPYRSYDIIPSLAATHFPAGSAREKCTISYSLNAMPVSEAPVPTLLSSAMENRTFYLPEKGWKRIYPAFSDCQKGMHPQPLVQVNPDFSAIKGVAGQPNWAGLYYDIDAEGKPVNIKVAYSSGYKDLNQASVKAIRQSRFAKGPFKGCFHQYWRSATPLKAPPAPDKESLQPAGSQCDDKQGWATPPRLQYPSAYQRRGVEGWAIIAYDVAPWGDTGNIRVLDSQPSADFGNEAVSMIRAAKKTPGGTGQTGCVAAVHFNMPR